MRKEDAMGLREVLRDNGLKQSALASYLGLAKSTVCGICNGQYPVGQEKDIRKRIRVFLDENGVKDAFHSVKPAETTEEEEEPEQRRVEMLTMTARKHFGIVTDPFTDDVRDKGDVYLTDSIRYVSEYMYMSAKNAGMIAVIGESGSGKSTLRKLLIDRIQESGEKIRIIFPRTLDRTRLTAAAICDAIISDVSKQTPRRSFEAKCRQVETVLSESARAGWSHVLMIEEAHDLSIQTLKYLKRFWELEDGFRKLLGIVLIAQPELKMKLDESRNWEARELIRRIEVVELDPFMTSDDVKGYLALKLGRAGASADRVFAEDAYAAVIEAMTRRMKSGQTIRFCYPLSVNNLVKRAMNEAAELCEPKVTAEIVNSVR